MEHMGISEFARRSRLSPKALRLYDEMGVLPPARVDPVTGYRSYGADQVGPARLVAALRQLGVPLAEVKAILDLEPEEAADRIAGYWSGVETEHATRRDLADVLVNRLRGKRSVMYEVETREMPSRSLLCLKRNVEGEAGAWAFGKEFVGLLKERRGLPPMDGRAGAFFCIYWGEVTDDSDRSNGAGRCPTRSPTPWRRSILNSPCAPNPPISRRSSTSARVAKPARRSGSWSRSRCGPGRRIRESNPSTWGSVSPTSRRHPGPVRAPRTATSPCPSPLHPGDRGPRSGGVRPRTGLLGRGGQMELVPDERPELVGPPRSTRDQPGGVAGAGQLDGA